MTEGGAESERGAAGGGDRDGDGGSLLSGYDSGDYFCEITGARDGVGAAGAFLSARLAKVGLAEMRRRAAAAERAMYNLGITFTVYSDKNAIDRVLPFDAIPRVISASEWRVTEAAVIQRVAALNHFLWDIYHDQKILKDGVVPPELILKNANYRPEMIGLDVPKRTYVHVCGIDLVRDRHGKFLVLEDNARTPSGVSYVIENRHMMRRGFADLMDDVDVLPVDAYGPKLHEAMAQIAPVTDPTVVLLSPGSFNSAYFEHIFLAREMGVQLVEGRDLFVENDRVFMKTIAGPARVDAIYRRIDDNFIDPEVFLPDSMLGVKGLMRAYAKGNVALANAVGTGVADDKAVYAYMPRIMRYYLDQDPIYDNVETHICREPEGLAFTLDHLAELVVKPVGESGGYGIVIGPRASEAELAAARAALIANPANFISQPVVDLSVCPTLVEDGVKPRHVDLRPFAITGDGTWVLPGGLTRVALRRGSLVVNSSQGGGSKDTWVLGHDGDPEPSHAGAGQ